MDKTRPPNSASENLGETITPSEGTEMAPVHSQGLQDDLEESSGESHFIMRLGPRPFGLLTIVLLTAGINLITALLDASSRPWERIISAICFTLAGILFFIVSAYIEMCYEGAKEQQRRQIELKRQKRAQVIQPLPILATDNLTLDKNTLRSTYVCLLLGIILLISGMGTLIFGITQRAGTTVQNASGPNTPASNEKPLKDADKPISPAPEGTSSR